MIMPIGIELSLWAASLVIDYPDDNVPLLIDENQWKEWGSFLVQCDTFIDNNAPGPQDFSNWNDWAERLYFTMENT